MISDSLIWNYLVFGDGSQTTWDGSPITHIYWQQGTYQPFCEIRTQQGCASRFDATLQPGSTCATTAVSDLETDGVRVYPTLVRDRFYVGLKPGFKMSFVLYDAAGRKVYDKLLTQSQWIARGSLARGIYFYAIGSGGKRLATGKLLFE